MPSQVNNDEMRPTERGREKKITVKRDSARGEEAHCLTMAVNKKRAGATATYFVRHQGETVLGFHDLANKLLLPCCWKQRNDRSHSSQPPLLYALDAYHLTLPDNIISNIRTTPSYQFFNIFYEWCSRNYYIGFSLDLIETCL